MKSIPINIKGITRNLTKIGVKDGSCDDLVNLRFKDGSWRVSNDGKEVYQMSTFYTYSQLYVHTNIYRHLLGVLNDKLWYFADIDNDGETFIPLETPIEICDVQGEITIVQNGHLLTIINGEEDFTYSIFKTSDSTYKIIKVDANGKTTDRSLYPFGEVHFNLSQRDDTLVEFTDTSIDATKGTTDGAFDPTEQKINAEFTPEYCRDKVISMFSEQTEKNAFTRPFVALAAIKLYDGSYMYASAPVLINPNEYANSMLGMRGYASTGYTSGEGIPNFEEEYQSISFIEKDENKNLDRSFVCVPVSAYKNGAPEYQYSAFVGGGTYNADNNVVTSNKVYKAVNEPLFSAGAHFYDNAIPIVKQSFRLLGFDLAVSVRNASFLMDNPDVFQSFCIFITPQVDIYDLQEEGELHYRWISAFDFYEYYTPKARETQEIKYDLMHNPMFLLREYTKNEIQELIDNPIVKLSDPIYNGLLKNITSSDRLSSTSFERLTYFPKTAYSYNQRLHIANYKTHQFHGYPIDLFHLNNHMVEYDEGNYAIGGMLPNLKEVELFQQYPKTKLYFADSALQGADEYVDLAKSMGTYFALISVQIETQQGEQTVVRYIKPYYANQFANGDNANFIESLSPLLTFPDSRAISMDIRVVTLYNDQTVSLYGDSFDLTPHPYLNMAYYISPTLSPLDWDQDFNGQSISITDFGDYGSLPEIFYYVKEKNATEDFPSGLKVSLTNNPFTFPYETTYQIGSAEIVALMSNAVTVGVGQTGAAPLYVFCKDGIYALLVDSSGELAYTNARIIARDVCNNAKSVTPIDSGVVFTTDRGLMSIAGNEVVEIGQAAEGDVFFITEDIDNARPLLRNVFKQKIFSNLPSTMLDNVDFLTYLKESIINYNHNERELIISNPNYSYSYIMDREGNWSRRDYKASEYVNNYPTSYRVVNSVIYKVDADDTSVNNTCFMLSQIIKLESIAFKQVDRLVVRGYFENMSTSTQEICKLGCYVFGSYDGRQWALIGGNEKTGKFTDIGCNIFHNDVKFLRVCIGGKLSHDSRIDYIEVAYDDSKLNNKLR